MRLGVGRATRLVPLREIAVNPTRLFILTLVAMIAFASNSLLCRAALKHTSIDAASFTLIRICSGAVALGLIMGFRSRLMVERSFDSSPVTRHSSLPQAGNWLSALALFGYAAAFSFAYNTLPAGTGALLLFGAVQATMILGVGAQASGCTRVNCSVSPSPRADSFCSCCRDFRRRLSSVPL